MKNMKNKLAALLAAVLLLTALCTGMSAAAEEPAVRVMVLNGTTGFGMANMISRNNAGELAMNCEFSVETDASNVTAALVNGSADIAALPTNAAAALYNKTSGAVQVLALNTKGVLYLVTDASVDVHSFEDLKGMTVYVPAQNPTFIFSYLCSQNGLNVGEDVVIDNTYAQPADLNAAVAGGQVSAAVLPEPMVTVVKMNNDQISVDLDLTEEWNQVAPEDSLVQGCIAVRKEFAEGNPELLAAFLKEYEQSILLLQEDAHTAAVNIEAAGILAKAAIAEKAIPNCNICFIAGEEMQSAMSDFLNIMFEVAPQSIGGAVPGEDFYCVLK